MDFCQHCHEDIEVNNDPLAVSHEQLILNQEWNTCLQCHDYHGNHIFAPSTKLNDTIPVHQVLEYYKGGKDPYGDVKKFIAEIE